MTTLNKEEKIQVISNIMEKADAHFFKEFTPANMEKQKTFVLDLDQPFNYGFTIAKLKVRGYEGMFENFDLKLYPRNHHDDPKSTEITSTSYGIMLAKYYSIDEYIEMANKANAQEIERGEKVMILVVSRELNVAFAIYVRFGEYVRPFCASPIPVLFCKEEVR